MSNAERLQLYLLYLIFFFHSETDWKKLVAQPGIEPGPPL